MKPVAWLADSRAVGLASDQARSDPIVIVSVAIPLVARRLTRRVGRDFAKLMQPLANLFGPTAHLLWE
jgi:hypothetical protein